MKIYMFRRGFLSLGGFMKYYSTWQEAFKEFIDRYGHNFLDAYNLSMEFEEVLQRNSKGTYFICWKGSE